MGRIKYTETHEWIEINGKIGTVGITERGQIEYSEVAGIELPEKGSEYEQEEPMCFLELVNGDTIPVYAPVTGEILAINEALEEHPDLINDSPEEDGWICKMSIEIPRELRILMDQEDYEEYDGGDEDELFEDEYE